MRFDSRLTLAPLCIAMLFLVVLAGFIALAPLPGPGNHAALRLLVAAGFSPLEVIRMATAEGARTQGIDVRVGTLRAGKQADLLLVNGNPDEDITHIGRIDLVFKNGIAYDPARLRDSIRGKIGR